MHTSTPTSSTCPLCGEPIPVSRDPVSTPDSTPATQLPPDLAVVKQAIRLVQQRKLSRGCDRVSRRVGCR